MGQLFLSAERYSIGNCKLRCTAVYIEFRGITGWCITGNSQSCLNEQGFFEYEPIPTNRTDDYLQRTRFDTKEEALAHFEKFHDRLVSDGW